MSDMDFVVMLAAAGVCIACILGLLSYLQEVTINADTELFEMREPNTRGIAASRLHLRPGEWPHTVPTTLGDGTAFIVNGRLEQGRKLLWVDYTQKQTGMTLRVFNDLADP